MQPAKRFDQGRHQLLTVSETEEIGRDIMDEPDPFYAAWTRAAEPTVWRAQGLLLAEAMLRLEGAGCVCLGTQTPDSQICPAARPLSTRSSVSLKDDDSPISS